MAVVAVMPPTADEKEMNEYEIEQYDADLHVILDAISKKEDNVAKLKERKAELGRRSF